MTFLPIPSHPPKSQTKINALKNWREIVFNKVIKAIGIAGSVAYFTNLALVYKTLSRDLLLVYTFAYLLIMVAAFLPRLSTVLRSYIFILVIFAVGVFTSFQYAAIGDGRVWFLLSILLSVVFLGQKAGAVFTALVTLTWSGIGYLFATSIIPQQNLNQFSFSFWAETTISLFLIGAIITLSISALLTYLNQYIEKNASLIRESEEFEKEYAAFEKRLIALEASAKISRELTLLTEHQEILNKVPKLLSRAFDLNSATVFLLNTENVLRLVSSRDWSEQAHSTRDYTLPLDKDIVGVAVTKGKAYSDKDSEVELNMALANTRSYVAIPLHGRNKVIGALVLQSELSDIFDKEMVDILQAFADQVALLLENADLLIQKESALKTERQAYRKITQAGWEDFIKAQNYGVFRRDEEGLSVLSKMPDSPKETSDRYERVPISIRGKIIGYIDARKPKNRAWTASEKELLRILTSRLESAMDSARLYQTSQERAERERIIAEASSQIRESLDIEGVLKVAARELRNNLDVAEAEVWVSAEYLQETGIKTSGEIRE